MAEVGSSASSSGVSLHNLLDKDSKESRSDEEISRADRVKNTVTKEERKQFLMVERQMQYYWREVQLTSFSVVKFLYQYMAMSYEL